MSDRPLPPTHPQEDDLEPSETNPFNPLEAPPEQDEPERPAPHGIKLTTFDVFALIVNKMVGSGIYNAPSSVLVLTGSKSTAMWLWVAGFAYTIFSMVIYLGYSAVFPYTGGELVYIDEMFSEGTDNRPRANTGESQRSNNLSGTEKKRTFYTKFFGDGLLAYTVYAVLFCTMFNSSTNALQVARETLVALRPEEDSPQMDVLRLIAVVALSILCLIQYWSSHAGRKINRWIAVIKLLFLVAVLVAGAIRTHYRPFEGNGFVECAPVQHSAVEAAKAMLLVIFSFEGWENATFVAGEIAPDNQGALRWGFMYAVTVVGFLYMAIVAVFMYAIPYTPVTVQFAPMLFGNSRGAYQAWAVIIAISALGNMNSIIYTFSRIKQCVGVGNIFPWSHFWASDSPDLKDHRNFDGDKSPKGGLWLHWIMSVILIAVSAGIHSPLESISFPGLLQTYTHCLILMFIAIGALRLPSRARDLKPTQERTKDSLDWKISRTDWGWHRPLYILVIVYLLANLMVVIVTAIPPYVSQDGIPGSELASDGWSASDDNKTLTCTSSDHSTSIKFGVPITPGKVSALRGWILPCASIGMLIIGIAYYFSLFGSRTQRTTIARIARVAPQIDRPSKYDFTRERVARFGSRRIIDYFPVDDSPDAKPNFWYWALGGESWYEETETETPRESMRRRKNMFKQHMKAIPMKAIGKKKSTRLDSLSDRGGSQEEEEEE